MRLTITGLKEDLQQFVWGTAEENYPPLQRRGIIALRILCLLIRDLREGQLNLRAMGLVYTTLLAMVPLVAVSFSVLKGFGVHNQVEPLLLGLLEPLGPQGVEITNRIIGFVDNIRAGILGSLGLAFLIYTVVSLLQKVERAFNFTWRVTSHRPLSQRFSDYITLILIGPVLIFSALGVTATISSHTIMQSLLQFQLVAYLLHALGYFLPLFLIVVIFSLVYKLVPNTNVKVKPAMIGAVVAGILWQLSSWAFANFVAGSSNYTVIYSAFATLIIFMIWLYLNWLILLIGCSIAFYYQFDEQRTLRPRQSLLSNRMREKLSLQVMMLIARHFYQHKPAWTLDALVKKLNVSSETLASVMQSLEASGLLLETAGDTITYVPGYAIETIRLADIIQSARQAGETELFSINSIPLDETVDNVYNELESSISSSFADRTLYDLCVTGKE